MARREGNSSCGQEGTLEGKDFNFGDIGKGFENEKGSDPLIVNISYSSLFIKIHTLLRTFSCSTERFPFSISHSMLPLAAFTRRFAFGDNVLVLPIRAKFRTSLVHLQVGGTAYYLGKRQKELQLKPLRRLLIRSLPIIPGSWASSLLT